MHPIQLPDTYLTKISKKCLTGVDGKLIAHILLPTSLMKREFDRTSIG